MENNYLLQSSIGELIISIAQYDDIGIVRLFIDEAGSWLCSRRINQWSPGKPSHQFLTLLVENQWMYMVHLGKQPIATITLQPTDTKHWGDDSGEALYLHLLVVCRSHGGNGIGRLLIQWALGRASAMGKKYLRLDCWAENEKLCAYYFHEGFSPKGQVEFENGWRAALYEKLVEPNKMKI